MYIIENHLHPMQQNLSWEKCLCSEVSNAILQIIFHPECTIHLEYFSDTGTGNEVTKIEYTGFKSFREGVNKIFCSYRRGNYKD